jgi:hypothetical protein
MWRTLLGNQPFAEGGRALKTKRAACLTLLLTILLLSACNTQEDEQPPTTTGEETPFELTGDVSAVDIEDVDFDVSLPAEGVNVGVDAGITVNLTVNIETIDDPSSQLCEVAAGQDAIVVVTEETDLDFDRPLSELGTLEDESIRASGTARQEAAAESPGQGTTQPAGSCRFHASSLSLIEEETPVTTATPSPTPSP